MRRQNLYSTASIITLLLSLVNTSTIAADKSHESTNAENISLSLDTQEVTQPVFELTSTRFQTRFDGFQTVPLLNAGTLRNDYVATVGQKVDFGAYTNYNAWIVKSEILLFAQDSTGVRTLFTTLDASNGFVSWTPPSHLAGQEVSYVLRVYDAEGNFDQTEVKTLSVVDKEVEITTPTDEFPGFYGVDATKIRNISVNGGAVTVYANAASLDDAKDVLIFGKPPLVDPQGDIAVQQILPFGDHTVDASYVREDGQTVTISRDVTIPESEWFAVAIGDVTIGTRSSESRALVEASGEDFDRTFVTGRGAFYLKGKIKGKYLLTAALDTTEDDIDNLFSNLNDKDPESLLRRLDPDRFYPVYGDDSTFEQDAPTQGRFYVRLERGDDHIVWGNFLTNITQTEFAQLDRGLYGAKAEFNSDETTSNGERKVRVTAFAADPGTIPAREEFRTTGGSVYFLQNQDISIGSERLRVEYRDEDSGLVVETVELEPFQDYDFDYIAGRVLLTRPLTSTKLVDQVVRDGPLSGRQAFLVARYEYSPGLADIGGFTLGGRAEAWFTDSLRLGITGQDEETGNADQRIISGDFLYRKTEKTYLKGEISQSSGVGFNEQASVDGGFSFNALTAASTDDDALAYRVESAVDFEDVNAGFRPGYIRTYYENLESGFSGAGRLTQNDTERYGGELRFVPVDKIKIDAKFDKVSILNQLEEDTIEVDLRADVTEKLNVGVGVRHNDIAGPNTVAEGERTDLGIEVRYAFRPGLAFYGFGQGTLSADDDRQEANRGGIGIDAKITDRYSVRGEASGGSGGFGGQLGVTYKVRDGEEYYLNYTLDAERQLSGVDGTNFLGTSQNTLSVGGRKRYNSVFSVFGEERASFGDTSGLTHAYGLDITPAEKWSVGLSFEVGELEQGTNLIEREAYVASLGYTGEEVTFGSAFEWLSDENNGITRDTWLVRSNLSLRVSQDWRALLKFNRAESTSTQGEFFNGDFTEAQIAGAYRPVNNDRLNGLLRYTYFEDLTSSAQISNSGATGLPGQRSHIFSIDANYQTTDWLTLGGKVGYRSGQVSLSRLEDDFIRSNTLLLVGRADIHFIRKWDALIEARNLRADLAGDSTFGALVAVYRHLGDNAKIGVGYNFTDFSDDLTDLSFNDNGVFLNIIAKY